MQTQTHNEFQFLVKVISYLRTHWWLFAIEICVVFAIWMTKFHRTPSVYDSHAQILIDTSTRKMYQSVFMGNRFGNDSLKQNMVHLLRSPEVMDSFRQRLTDFYHENGSPTHLAPFFPGGQAYPSSQFLNWVNLSWNKDSDIYGIRCVATNPDAAHDLCRVYLGTLEEAYPKFGQRGVQNKRDFLARQVSSLHRQIVEREKFLAGFERENSEFMRFRTAFIENKSLSGLRTEHEGLKRKLALNRSIKRMFLEERSADVPNSKLYAQAMAKVKERLSELLYREHLTEQVESPDRDRRLATIRAEITQVQEQINELSSKEMQSLAGTNIDPSEHHDWMKRLDVQYNVSKIQIANLQKDINEIERLAVLYRETSLKYNRLNSELTHKRRLLANLYQKEQETEIELAAVRSEIFKLREPTRSGHRIEPQLTKHIFAAISLSIFVMVVTSLLLTVLFPRLDNESEVHRLNVPVLGKIPTFKEWGGRIQNSNPFGLEYLKIVSYRILRETKAAKCPKIIVTSPQAGEGKSTVTYLLTLASQSPERKVLFIDGDLITNSPNLFFGMREDVTPGLKEVFDKGVDNVDLDSLIVETEQKGVYYLPRGGRADSVSSPNYLNPVAKALSKLETKFDIIFIDTPPLFTSSLAHQWTGLGDLVVLVARMFLTRPKDLVEALQTCKIFTKAPVGVALNCLPMFRGPGKGSYYYYFSRYAPGNHRKKNNYLSAS